MDIIDNGTGLNKKKIIKELGHEEHLIGKYGRGLHTVAQINEQNGRRSGTVKEIEED